MVISRCRCSMAACTWAQVLTVPTAALSPTNIPWNMDVNIQRHEVTIMYDRKITRCSSTSAG